jgi:all-trans-retinol 13,14-reductase
MSAVATNWDVICIGAGISSLAFGAQLARWAPKLRVLIVDKHYAPGGYATVFYRRKKRFDCSLHKLSGMGEGGNLRRILTQDLGLGDEIEPVHAIDYFEILSPGA